MTVLLGGDHALTEHELATSMLSEAATGESSSASVVPGDGPVVREDGSILTAIIRPCMSRGARIRNMRVIYTPNMLRENASVFTGWPMFRDHAIVVSEAMREAIEAEADDRQEMVEAICESWMASTERFEEAVKKIGRSVDDLAGRITRSWWDPDIVFEDDAVYGYQQGGVAGLSLLLPSLRESVNADPGLMHVSINGYPTSGKPMLPPWGGTEKGMAIEGIRRVPMGSVDTVVRGGAGGRFMRSKAAAPAKPVTEREVSPTQVAYRGSAMEVTLTPSTSADQLRAFIAEHAPQLSPLLSEASTSAAPAAAPAASAAGSPLTMEQITTAIREGQDALRAELATSRETLREELRGEGQQTVAASVFEREAHRLIEAAAKGSASGGFLPPRWVADLKARYSIRPDGAAPALLVEAEETGGVVTKSAMDVLRESVTADINYARDLIAEAAGAPVVAGQGGQTPAQREGETTTAKPAGRSWLTELDSMHMIEHDSEGKIDTRPLFESMVS